MSTFVMLDSPNRGANMNPSLQAIVLEYATQQDKAALTCPAAQALLTCRPSNIIWHTIRNPFRSRIMPVNVERDSSVHDAYWARLKGLNDHNGYLKSCRLVAVLSGSRRGSHTPAAPFHLWLPLGFAWTLSESPEDHQPGSLLPKSYVDLYTVQRYEPIAGTLLVDDPTLLPTKSALDAGPNEKPPFDDWYARPDFAPQIAHDEVDPDEAAYVLKQMEESKWNLPSGGAANR